jgi:hypothetical protein
MYEYISSLYSDSLHFFAACVKYDTKAVPFIPFYSHHLFNPQNFWPSSLSGLLLLVTSIKR